VEAIVESGVYVRYGKWNQSIAIGTQRFAENTKQKLDMSAKGRKIVLDQHPLFRFTINRSFEDRCICRFCITAIAVAGTISKPSRAAGY
jgi:hypothetical protein